MSNPISPKGEWAPSRSRGGCSRLGKAPPPTVGESQCPQEPRPTSLLVRIACTRRCALGCVAHQPTACRPAFSHRMLETLLSALLIRRIRRLSRVRVHPLLPAGGDPYRSRGRPVLWEASTISGQVSRLITPRRDEGGPARPSSPRLLPSFWRHSVSPAPFADSQTRPPGALEGIPRADVRFRTAAWPELA